MLGFAIPVLLIFWNKRSSVDQSTNQKQYLIIGSHHMTKTTNIDIFVILIMVSGLDFNIIYQYILYNIIYQCISDSDYGWKSHLK